MMHPISDKGLRNQRISDLVSQSKAAQKGADGVGCAQTCGAELDVLSEDCAEVIEKALIGEGKPNRGLCKAHTAICCVCRGYLQG